MASAADITSGKVDRKGRPQFGFRDSEAGFWLEVQTG